MRQSTQDRLTETFSKSPVTIMVDAGDDDGPKMQMAPLLMGADDGLNAARASSAAGGQEEPARPRPPTPHPKEAEVSPTKFAPRLAPCEACGTPTQVKMNSKFILCAKEQPKLRQFLDQAARAGKGQVMQEMMASDPPQFMAHFRSWLAACLAKRLCVCVCEHGALVHGVT